MFGVHRLLRLVRMPQYRRAQYVVWLRRLGIRYVSTRVGAISMWVDLADEALGKPFFIQQNYEPFETSLVESLAQPGMTVLDAGANIGYYALHLALRVTPGGRVFAFEPDATNFSLLCKNARLNRITNVVCLQAAVLDQDGAGTLYLSQNNTGDHRVFNAVDSVFDGGLERKTTPLRLVAIDSFAAQNQLEVDLLKMDIQGAEGLALPGMSRTLSNPHIVFFFEFWPYGLAKAHTNPTSFIQALQHLGLQLYEINETKRQVAQFDLPQALERLGEYGYTNLIGAHVARCQTIPFLQDAISA